MNYFDVLFGMKLEAKKHPAVIKKRTGNPIELTDGADAPMVRCVTQITGYQEGSGTPSPDNVRPITAYTEGEIEVRKHNIYDGEAVAGYIYNGTTYYSTSYKMSKNYIPVKPNTSYKAIGVTGDGQITYYSESKTYLSSVAGMGGETRIFTTPSDCYFIKFYNPNANMDGNVGINYPSTFTEYEPYVGTTHTTTYPNAIYRGSEDCVEGEVETVKIKISKKWSEGTSATVIGDYTRKVFALPSDAVFNDANAICNVAPRILNYTSDELHFYVAESTALVFLPNDTDGNTDIEIAYELATPTTSPVTPTNLPIKSLSGYNHIESSTGEMEIDYITEGYQNFVDTVESALPNTRKGGTRAMDIFLSLDLERKQEPEPEPKKEEKTEEPEKEVKK